MVQTALTLHPPMRMSPVRRMPQAHDDFGAAIVFANTLDSSGPIGINWGSLSSQHGVRGPTEECMKKSVIRPVPINGFVIEEVRLLAARHLNCRMTSEHVVKGGCA